MEAVHFYETTVTWTKDRIGELTEPTLPAITVATPPEFPKGVPNIWSPEHLFLASVNVCLMTTFLSIAENSKLDFSAYTADSKAKLEKVDGKFMISEIELMPKITVSSEKDKERAIRIIEKAEEHCLISNSIKSKVHLNPEIIIG